MSADIQGSVIPRKLVQLVRVFTGFTRSLRGQTLASTIEHKKLNRSAPQASQRLKDPVRIP